MLLQPPSTDDLRARGACAACAAGSCSERHAVQYTSAERARVFSVILLYVVACVFSSRLPAALALACSLVASCLYIPALVELELYMRAGRKCVSSCLCASSGHGGLCGHGPQ